MLNRVVLVGRLTRDPELRFTPNGVAVAKFTIAVNRPFSNQEGKREADFLNCVVWRRPAENLANYMKKGNLIGVDGRLQTRSFDGQDGKKVFVTEVVCDSVQFLESKGSGNDNQGSNQSGNQGYNQNGNQRPNNQNPQDYDPYYGHGVPVDISDDGLPF
ncbi:single-stranded DNA-binding protein [Aquibacillus sp. 3ASR75-11]|uniref:Single-stranded DNA-binding protein n=1 Tax=Terrihalobacillus insolitus TaxID=2950438 RepID=A0A9X3WW11_9BACI|nr:single-stranded DNA-binding protein [Terrihalobacillus insolitus]MDC3424369.1 single-stranded DNA-binding protein [Terrihalobacillus insolitus]